MGLFDEFKMRGVRIPNRIVVSPMSQYASKDGFANDWHFAHLSRFALGGAGLIFTEATAVEAQGRRTHGDLGLWQDDQIDELKRIVHFIKSEGAVAGIQLGHAGRKASERRPWDGETPVDDTDIAERDEAPWPTLGPSAIPYAGGWHIPEEMTRADIERVKYAFRDAAARAASAGFEVIEVYAAHGFLLHQFYSPIANVRLDDYGGSFENRVRLCLEVADSIRLVWPEERALIFRISATDWVDGGWEVEESIELARLLKARGVDAIDCSIGGIGGRGRPRRMTLEEGFQVPFAERIRHESDIATVAVGMIWSADFADRVVQEGRADLVAIARELLADTNWPLKAMGSLGIEREPFENWKPAFGWWLNKRERLVRKLGLR